MIETKTASKEVFHKIVHDDGRQTWYFTDHRGREFFTLIGRRGEFQGTHPLNRVQPAIKGQPAP